MKLSGILCLLVGVTAAALTGNAAQVTLFEQRTAFQYLRVVEDVQRGERFLCNEKCDFVQGGILLAEPERLWLGYMRTAMVGLAFLEEPPVRVLFIGMGIGAMPRYLVARYPDTAVDIVEIDPAVPDIAERFFFFRATGRMRVEIADGARFVRSSRNSYDMIFLDAAFGPEMPEALASPEFLRRARERLAAGGVLVVNTAPAALAPSSRSFAENLRAEFPLVAAFATPGPANVIMVACKSVAGRDGARVVTRARAITSERKFDFGLAAVAEQRLSWEVR